MCSLQSVMCPQMVTMFPTPRWTYDAQQGGDLEKRLCHGDTLEVQHFSYVSPCQCTIGTSSKTLVDAFIFGTHKCFPYSTRAEVPHLDLGSIFSASSMEMADIVVDTDDP